MGNRLQQVIFFVLCIALLFCSTGCTTTQKGAGAGAGIGAGLGAGIGAGVGGKKGALIGAGIGALTGALGGALAGDQIDKKREEAEKKEYKEERDAFMKEKTNESITIGTNNGELFTRVWKNEHWTYIPTNNPNDANLYRRGKDENDRWIFIPINNNEKGGDTNKLMPSNPTNSNMEDQLPIFKNEGFEKANNEIEKELEAIRNENKQ